MFWSNTGWGGEKYYNYDVVWEVAHVWNSPIIRAAMGIDAAGGYIWDENENQLRIEEVIDAAIAEGIYVIVDWHSHHAENYTTEAVSFFKYIAEYYGSYPNIIYEIYNEPLNVDWNKVIKPYAETVIKAIREKDPDNIIIVGTPNWSQDVDDAARIPIKNYSNIAYSLHFYAGTHKEWLIDRAQNAPDYGIALVVTEWGTVNANGDGDVDTKSVDAWVDFMRENNLIHCNWSLNDKNEGASMLKPQTSNEGFWSEDDFTESGTVVLDIIQNWEGNYVDLPNEEKSIAYTLSSTDKSISIQTDAIIHSYTVINTIGKAMLYKQSLYSNNIQIDISELSAGIHFILLETTEGTICTKIPIN